MNQKSDAEVESFTLRTLLNIAKLTDGASVWSAKLDEEVTLLTDMCEDGKVVAVLMKYNAFSIICGVLALEPQKGMQVSMVRLLKIMCCFKVCLKCLAESEFMLPCLVQLYHTSHDSDTLIELQQLWLNIVEVMDHPDGPYARDEPALTKLATEVDGSTSLPLSPTTQEEVSPPAVRIFEALLVFFVRGNEGHNKLTAILMNALRGDLLTTTIEMLATMCETSGEGDIAFGVHMATPQLVHALVTATVLLNKHKTMTPVTAQKCAQICAGFTAHESGRQALLVHHKAVENVLVCMAEKYFNFCLGITVVVLEFYMQEKRHIRQPTVNNMLKIYKRLIQWCRQEFDWEDVEESDAAFGCDSRGLAQVMDTFFKKLVEYNDSQPCSQLCESQRNRIADLMEAFRKV